MSDPDIESAKKDVTRDPASSDEEEPTVEQQGVMTPGKDAVEEANASGVNPQK
jgi:hypothetical protein